VNGLAGMKRLWEGLSAGLGLSVFGVALSCLVGVVLGAGSFTAYFAEVTSYLRDDPRACVNCHVMREHYDAWQKSGHHTAAVCNDCHLPHNIVGRWQAKIRNGLFHSTAFTLQNFHEPIRIHGWNERIVRSNCVECHREFVSHVVANSQLDCVHCHRGVGHSLNK
jgi:cytochrome c nitrite reductase small subunit